MTMIGKKMTVPGKNQNLGNHGHGTIVAEKDDTENEVRVRHAFKREVILCSVLLL